MQKYQQVEELALANFELLLIYWGVPFQKINNREYDFINIARADTNFGACRFNTDKNKGADFAGIDFTNEDYALVGAGLGKEDFEYVPSNVNTNWGFNIIGLCQRLHKCYSYKDAAILLKKHLLEINSDTPLKRVTQEYIDARNHKLQEDTYKKLKKAQQIWAYCKPIEGTLGETYLKSRSIHLVEYEPHVRFHAKVYNNEVKGILPALLFKVSITPASPLVAIHRIYLASDGSSKAKLENQKIALGSIKGAAIWFGEHDKTLSIAEGPETALAIRSLGYPFVACAVSGANFSNLVVPDSVEEILLFGDLDKAGREAVNKAKIAYKKPKRVIKVHFPPKINKNGKTDWNDVLIDRIGRGK